MAKLIAFNEEAREGLKRGVDTLAGTDPFLLQADGKGWLFAPSGLMDGPLPTHYEPLESPVPNFLYGQQCNPARYQYRRRDNPMHRAWADPRYPYVLTTYRLIRQDSKMAWNSDVLHEISVPAVVMFPLLLYRGHAS